MGLIFKVYKESKQLNSKKNEYIYSKNKYIYITMCVSIYTHIYINQSSYKMNMRPEQTFFFQRRQTDGQQVHEKMLNIISHQGDANRNHQEISPYTC